MTTSDPGDFFRDMLGKWEGVANQFGAELMKSGEFAKTVQGAATAGMKAQSAAKEAMSRALAAANMPSREDLVDVTARMRGIEARLDRIETLLTRLAGEPAGSTSDRPKPKRTKKPLKPSKKDG